MKKHFDLVAVIPVGPPSKPAYVSDTIESILFYVDAPCKVIVVDNSQCGMGRIFKQQFPDIDVLVMGKDGGKMGGLYINLCKAFRYAYDTYEFTVLLRMDDDAMIIGRNPHLQGVELFTKHPEVGMAGRYITGQLSPDMYGNVHDNFWPRKQIMKDAFSWKFIRRPVANFTLRELSLKAFRQGYELGENIQGGAYFISRLCIGKLIEQGYMPVVPFRNVWLCEDHILSMLTKLVGMQLADLSGPGQPFGVAWQGLPASPEKLKEGGKKIIHSVRFFKEMNQDDIRRYFAECRKKEMKPVGQAAAY